MKNLLVIGHFAMGKTILDGQIVKTITFTEALENLSNKYNIKRIDTHKWERNPLSLFSNIISNFFKTDYVLILPGRRGLRVFLPLLLFLSHFRRLKIFYIVIGGWLPSLASEDKKLRKKLRRIDQIYVETQGMKIKLDQLEFKNVSIIPNFKSIDPVQDIKVWHLDSLPIPVCTFSRVSKEKGISLAIEAINMINEKYGEIMFQLHIYGQVEELYKDELNELLETYSKQVSYKGQVGFNNSVDTLKEYYLLIFPTYYVGEGFAGTLVDAMFAGIPALASDWKYNEEIIKHKQNGLIFESKNVASLVNQLEFCLQNNDSINDMRETALRGAMKLEPSLCLKPLVDRLY